MSKLALNKGTLHRLSTALRVYQRALPSLDMKRKQLAVELQRARRELAQREDAAARLRTAAAADLPMLADPGVEISGLLRIQQVSIDEQNLLGTRLPQLRDIEFETLDYALLARPHWVDTVLARIKEQLTLQIEIRVHAERVQRLERALRRTLQRVNLLEKVLIPRARRDIGRIKVALADADRAAVVRAKMNKHKRMLTDGAAPA